LIVADTNLIAYLLINGEYTEAATSIFNYDSSWAVPYLWRSEFSNILTLYLRKKLMTISQAKDIMQEAQLLIKSNEYEINPALVLDLALETGLSAYDCEYVVLAINEGLFLVTNDQKILKAKPQIAVSISDFVDDISSSAR
jgi:predicted nucleic acid-binding protein